MTRRDVAAMRLALECCRMRVPWSPEITASVRDELVSDRTQTALAALRCASPWGPAGDAVYAIRWAQRRVAPRLLRARLAIALRVLLRAADGDYGPTGWVGDSGHRYGWGDAWPADDNVRWQRLPVRPLWEQAPPWSPEVTPRQRGER